MNGFLSGPLACSVAVVDAATSHRPKPDPEIFFIAMNEFGLNASDCWVIEDSVNGLLAAKAAGCFAVGITTTFDAATLSNARTDFAVDSFAELRPIGETLTQRSFYDYLSCERNVFRSASRSSTTS
jgi:beta-phosphoglucomutase-like phosphatase (HAD superfamily)